MSDLKKIKKAVESMLAKWEAEQLKPFPKVKKGNNPYTVMATNFIALRRDLSFIEPDNDVKPEDLEQLDANLENVIDDLNAKAHSVTTNEALRLIDAFIAINQDVEKNIQEIKNNVATVGTVTDVLSYIDRLIEVAAALAPK